MTQLSAVTQAQQGKGWAVSDSKLAFFVASAVFFLTSWYLDDHISKYPTITLIVAGITLFNQWGNIKNGAVSVFHSIFNKEVGDHLTKCWKEYFLLASVATFTILWFVYNELSTKSATVVVIAVITYFGWWKSIAKWIAWVPTELFRQGMAKNALVTLIFCGSMLLWSPAILLSLVSKDPKILFYTEGPTAIGMIGIMGLTFYGGYQLLKSIKKSFASSDKERRKEKTS